jgi:hypothetical protein
MSDEDPSRYDPKTDAAGRKETNALLWGGVCAAFAAIVAVGAGWAGEVPGNRLLQNPGSAAAVGFFWGWAAGEIKNWLGRRNRRY